MNKKILSGMFVIVGIIFVIISLAFQTMDMTLSGIVLIIGGVLMRFYKNVLSIVLSFIGIDLVLLPFLLAYKKMQVMIDYGELGIVGGADFPTFTLLLKNGESKILFIIGFLILIISFVFNLIYNKKK